MTADDTVGGCCGMHVVSDLDSSSKDVFVKKLRNVINDDELFGAIIIATTNNHQVAEAQWLRELGFTLAIKEFNPKSGNTVFLWSKSLVDLREQFGLPSYDDEHGCEDDDE